MDILDFKKSVKHKKRIQEMACVYVLNAVGSDFYKIGFAKNLNQRISSIQVGCPFELRIVNCANVPNHRSVERYLHDEYSEFQVRGEWFEFSSTEVDEIFDFFQKIGDSLKVYLRG